MSLTISTAPPSIAGAKRPIPVVFTTDQTVTAAGTASVLVLVFNSAAAVDETLVLNFNGNTVTFTAKASPSSNNEFLSGTTAAAALITYFNNNYLINSFYILTVDAANRIRFTARYADPAYDMAIAGSTWAGVAVHSSTAGVAAVSLLNFQTWLDLYVEQTFGSGDYGSTPVAKLSSNYANGEMPFDLSSILEGYLDTRPPDYNDTVARACGNKMLRRYKFNYLEAWGSPIEPMQLSTSAVFTALHGRKELQQAGTAGNVLTLAPLTNRPTTKKATAEQNEWIYLLVPSGTNIDYNYTAYYTDGSSQSSSLVNLPSISTAQVWAIPAGYTQSSIAAINPAKTVERWSLNIAHAGGDFNYYYTLESKCPEHTRYFIFRNERGGYDTIIATGRMESSGEIERMNAQKVLSAAYALTDREAFSYQPSSLDRFTIHTGWIFTKTEAEYYIRQFLQSEDVWMQDGSLIPIVASTKEALYTKDRNNLYGFGFAFQRSQMHMDRHTSL